MKKNINKRKKTGFTLVELLVVIAIIGILTMVSVSSFTSSKIKASDSQRKSDLDSISKALMMYYNDKGVFPDSFPFGAGGVDGLGFTGDNQIVYMTKTPKDPTNSGKYFYVYGVNNNYNGKGQKAFNLFANLENSNDSQCQQVDGLGKYLVDGKNYCYGISSPNTIVDQTKFSNFNNSNL